MTSRLKIIRSAAIAMVAMGGSSALAQSVQYPGLNIERFSFNASGEDSLVVDTGSILKKGETRLSLAAHLAAGESVTRVGDEYASLRLDERLMGTLAIAYAPASWFQVDFQLPLMFNQTGSYEFEQRGFAPLATSGVMSPLVGARIAFLRQDDGGPMDMSIGASVGLPFGEPNLLAQDREMPVRPMLAMGYDFGTVKFGGVVYGQLRSQENFGYRGVSPSDEDTVDHEVGAAFALTGKLGEKLRAELDVMSDFSLKNPGNSTQAMVGLRYLATPKLEMFAAAGPGFGSLVGTPEFRMFAGLGYNLGGGAVEEKPAVVEPVVVDTDTDGIADEKDQCIAKAEDQDSFQDEDGCPDEDNDADGVADANDACPNVAGEAHLAGCKLPDDDQDGIANNVDQCPKEKGDIAENGCPAKDRDQDGIVDRMDQCPTKAAPAGSATGCPDSDNDGLADNEDNCVVEAGPKDNQGCPKKQKQLVVITKEKLKILDKVYFAVAKATIQPKSRILLNQIAKILKEHPEIQKVSVEGHTDERGKAQWNMKLSQERADTVRAYLVKAGVAPERIVAKGFGETRPVQANASGPGANRRVEFVLVDGNGKAAEAEVSPELAPLKP